MQFTEIDDDSEHSSHTPAERAKAASRTTWVSVVVNLVLSATQIAVGVLAKSQGLVADGVHSLSDLVADFVVLLAGRQSQKDADLDHPYGHQRFENAASLVLGLLLLGVSAGMIWSAVGKLETPASIATAHPVALWVALAALAGVIGGNAFITEPGMAAAVGSFSKRSTGIPAN
jgi:cation diffusion facilitator family transporter